MQSNFVDYVKINCRAGHGGAGSASLHREKYIDKGGPDGGDGGRGGNITLLGNSNLWTLLEFRFKRHFRAQNGGRGGKSRSTGADGEDIILEVPIGTIAKDDEGNIIGEVTENGQELIIAQGGKGGLGNWHFRSATRQTPRYAQPGLDGDERQVTLELKILADVGLVGFPNAGKSTLLNALLNEERAIVSDIEGTTRDTIEETIYIDGVGFRFIDTAGIREAGDTIERIGIEKTFEKIDNASIIIYLYDANITADNQIANQLDDLQRRGKILFNVANKIDVNNNESAISDAIKQEFKDVVHLEISAKDQYNIEALKENLIHQIKLKGTNQDDTIVTNSRHLEALQNTLSQIGKIKQGMDMGLPGDLLAMDIREALTYLGHITGEIDVDQDILGTIFGKFCIGK